jgi:hypothetical protein
LKKILPRSRKSRKSKEKSGLSLKTSSASSALRLKNLQVCLFFKDLKVNAAAPGKEKPLPGGGAPVTALGKKLFSCI